MADVIVVGAGLAGLVTAHRLAQLGADVQVVERSKVAGGNVQTVERDGWRHERGPNSFQGSANALFSLAEELELAPVKAREAARTRYLFIDGALRKLPLSPPEALASPLLPPAAKLRLLAEPLTFSKARDDETVREFFENRFGPQVVERFVDPFVSGIYGGDVAQLGAAAAFPRLFAMAKEHGSLFKAGIAMARRGQQATRKGLYSFTGGLGTLTRTLEARLESRVHLDEQVLVRRERDEWQVGEYRARSLVLAAPAWATARLVHGELPALAAELAAVDYAPMVGVHLRYPKKAITRSLDGFGFLIPRSEGLRTLGVLWPSSLFDVCDEDHAVLTCFIGGARDRGAVGLGEGELVAEVRRDLRRAMGIDAAPNDVSIVRHERAIPQYSTRHLPWRERVTRLVGAQPGLHVTGNWLEGISMNDTVAHAERTAREAFAKLGKEAA